MRVAFGWMAVGCLLSAGCSNQPSNASKPTDAAVVAESAGGSATTGSTATTEENSSGTAAAAANAAPLRSGVARLTPENTKIQFVGVHVGPRPDRTGGFEKFTGEAELHADGKTLKSVSVEIETGSIWTQHGGLTQHLNSPDFFDAKEYPIATFESARIEPAGGDGQYTITGDLTLLETTKEIQFPATVTIDDAGLGLRAAFTIDRTEFGMDKFQDQVKNPVALTIVIGEKTEPLPSQDPPGGGGPRAGGPGGPGQPRGGGFDPAAFFKQRDANGDGKLAGDEIPGPMRQNIASIDANGDGEITKEEFQARMPQFGGGRPGAAGPGAGGRPGPADRPRAAAEPGDAGGADDGAENANEADDTDEAADDEADGTQQAGTRNAGD